MKKENFYQIVIVCLLLLNAGTLAYLWYGQRMRPGPDGGPDKVIIDRLKLDEQQQQQFEHMKQDHHGHMMHIQHDMARLHDQLFQLLQSEPIDTVREQNLMQQIQQLNMEREQLTFDHFKELRAILNPDQQTSFDDFVGELGRQIMSPHQRHGRPPGGRRMPPPPGRP